MTASHPISLGEWHCLAIDEGLRAADEGQVVEHEDVVAWVASWNRPDEKSMPKCD